MNFRSLRFRLALGTGIISAVSFAGAVGVSYRLIHNFSLDEFDIELREKALLFADQIKQDAGAPQLHFTPASLASGEKEHKEFAELWDSRGECLGRAPRWSGRDLVPSAMWDSSGVDVVLPNGSNGRQVTVAFEWQDKANSASPPRQLVLVVAQDDGVLAAALNRIFFALVASGVIAAVCTMLGATWVIGRLLAPVRQLAVDLDGIGQHDLAVRLKGSSAPEELQPVVLGLNALLARLETAFIREQTLTADLAHELRTPLHGLRLTLDVALVRPREADQYRKTLEDCRVMVIAIQAMAQDLLVLARLDADTQVIRQESTALLALLQSVWQPLEELAKTRGLTMAWPTQEAAVLTNAEWLRPALSNVLGNAVAHANAGGEIKVTLTEDGDNLKLKVANTGSQVAAENADKVFERFWRNDAARSREADHSGLGLAIVQRIVALLDIPVRVQSEVGGWFEVSFFFKKA